MRLRNLSILALPLAALAVAGCGGGGGDSTSTPTTTETTTALSKEELIARGDSICAEVNAAVGTVGASSEESTTSQVGQVADLYIGMVESLKGIGTPDDATGYSEFIATGEELSQTENEAKLADERGDSAALGEAETEATSALAAFESAATSYGFKECGREPSAPAPTSTESGESSEPETSEVEESVEPEAEAAAEEDEEVAPETGGGAGTEAPPAGESSGGGSSGGVGPG